MDLDFRKAGDVKKALSNIPDDTDVVVNCIASDDDGLITHIGIDENGRLSIGFDLIRQEQLLKRILAGEFDDEKIEFSN